jgi:hypothetical protein
MKGFQRRGRGEREDYFLYAEGAEGWCHRKRRFVGEAPHPRRLRCGAHGGAPSTASRILGFGASPTILLRAPPSDLQSSALKSYQWACLKTQRARREGRLFFTQRARRVGVTEREDLRGSPAPPPVAMRRTRRCALHGFALLGFGASPTIILRAPPSDLQSSALKSYQWACLKRRGRGEREDYFLYAEGAEGWCHRKRRFAGKPRTPAGCDAAHTEVRPPRLRAFWGSGLPRQSSSAHLPLTSSPLR